MVRMEPAKMADFFQNTRESFLWSCKQGIMGSFYVKEAEQIRAALAVLGDFTFFDGEPDRGLVTFLPKESNPDFRILVPPDKFWGRLIEESYIGHLRKITRYRMKKKTENFDTELLKQASKLPKGYTFQDIDRAFYKRCKEEEWSRDFTAQFSDYEKFRQYGRGVLVLKNGKPVSGASSYSAWQGGIEIEVDTKKEYRRKGLAFACSARLILECLKEGFCPSWDAHTEVSLALAKKLGYELEAPYLAYEVKGVHYE